MQFSVQHFSIYTFNIFRTPASEILTFVISTFLISKRAPFTAYLAKFQFTRNPFQNTKGRPLQASLSYNRQNVSYIFPPASPFLHSHKSQQQKEHRREISNRAHYGSESGHAEGMQQLSFLSIIGRLVPGSISGPQCVEQSTTIFSIFQTTSSHISTTFEI